MPRINPAMHNTDEPNTIRVRPKNHIKNHITKKYRGSSNDYASARYMKEYVRKLNDSPDESVEDETPQGVGSNADIDWLHRAVNALM